MIQEDFHYFEQLKLKGISPEEAYLEAKKQQLNPLTCLKMLRSIYALNLPEAKKIAILATNNKVQNSPASSSEILNQYQRKILDILNLTTNMEIWEFHQNSEGQWYWKTYKAPNGEIEEQISTDNYDNLQACFNNAKTIGYKGGIVTQQELLEIKQLIEHNPKCSPNEVIYESESGGWYNPTADESRFEKVDKESNVFEIDSHGVLTYLGKSWELAAKEKAFYSSNIKVKNSHITLDLPKELEAELKNKATQIGLSLSEYILRVLSRSLIKSV